MSPPLPKMLRRSSVAGKVDETKGSLKTSAPILASTSKVVKKRAPKKVTFSSATVTSQTQKSGVFLSASSTSASNVMKTVTTNSAVTMTTVATSTIMSTSVGQTGIHSVSRAGTSKEKTAVAKNLPKASGIRDYSFPPKIVLTAPMAKNPSSQLVISGVSSMCPVTDP